MKKTITVILMLIFWVNIFLCGCNDNSTKKNDYVVNHDGIINVGVLLPLSGDNKNLGDKISDGINFASELAPGVNINNENKHLINLIYEDVNGNIEAACNKFVENNVAAVICSGATQENTGTIVSAFKGQSTALLFTDCFSNDVLSDANTLSISVPSAYQASVASTYFTENSLKTGAVVVPGDNYGQKFSEQFKNTFISSGGSSVSEYLYDCNESSYNAKTIAGSETEFVFVIGPEEKAKAIYLELIEAGLKAPVILSEVTDKTNIENNKFNNLIYISKFEQDDSNYIGTDFIKTYTKMKDVNSSDITTATVYGYDAYMLVYGALMSFNSNSFTAEINSDVSTNTSEVYSSQVLSALKNIVHMGVSDSITFNEFGTVNTKFLYMSSIQNGNSIMLNKYNYEN